MITIWWVEEASSISLKQWRKIMADGKRGGNNKSGPYEGTQAPPGYLPDPWEPPPPSKFSGKCEPPPKKK